MRPTILLPVLLLTLVACGERKEPEKTPAPVSDTTAPTADLVQAPPRDTGFNPANVENFEKLVYAEYAHVGTQVPRHVLDSIIRVNRNPMQIEEQMNQYMQHHDTLARVALAGKYGIGLDSLNAILARRAAVK